MDTQFELPLLYRHSIPTINYGFELLVGTGLLCLFFYLLCYAALLIKFTYYAQNYAQE